MGWGQIQRPGGAECKEEYRPFYGDSVYTDSIVDWNVGPTYPHFLPLMKPYAWAWYDWEKEQYPNEIPTYTPDTTVEEPSVKARYPNKSFLEVVNVDDLFDNGIHSGRINL